MSRIRLTPAARVLDLFTGDQILSAAQMRRACREIGYAGREVLLVDVHNACREMSRTTDPTINKSELRRSGVPSGYAVEYSHRHPLYTSARRSIDALYALTDRLPRDCYPASYGDVASQCERHRPHCWSIAMGHLRLRWLVGNFAVPREETMIRWIVARLDAEIADPDLLDGAAQASDRRDSREAVLALSERQLSLAC